MQIATQTQRTPYQDGVTRIQRAIDTDLALQTAPDQDGFQLRPHTESYLRPSGASAKATVVLLHGYTAGPWQYDELADRFHDAGYNVYVPRLPGHGFQDSTGTPTGAKLPRSDQRYLWESFIDTTYEDAAALGAPVYAIGLSGGADAALRMAEKHPDIKGLAAMAPYLGGNPPGGLVFTAFNVLDSITFGVWGKLMDHVPWHHNVKAPNDPHPHTQGTLGQAMVMEDVGRTVRKIECPAQLLTVDGDVLSGSIHVGSLMRRSGDNPTIGWYRFHKDEGVPHAMVSPVENKAPGGAQKVSDVLFDFVDKGILTDRR